jgi:hypothetical protein
MQPTPHSFVEPTPTLARPRDASAILRDQWRTIVDSSQALGITTDDLLGEERAYAVLRKTISAYVLAWRSADATPEKMLVDLKAVIREATIGLEPELQRRVSAEVVAWSIEEFFALPPE